MSAELEASGGPIAAAKIIFINRYFYPDESATSQMLSDMARKMAESGADVRVICSRQLYGDANARLPERETAAGIHIYRVWTSRFGRMNLAGRAFDYVSFYLSTAFRLWVLARPGDIVVAKTDPPVISIVAAAVSRMRGARLVNWLQDVFPEVASALGQNPLPRSLDRVLRNTRNWSLSVAHRNIVLGERMREHLLVEGIADTRISIIENWADGRALKPRSCDSSELRQREKLAGRFIVGYSGNLGRAHEFDTLLSAARLLRGVEDIVFLMIGDGAGMQRLRAAVESEGLTSFRFLPYQPRGELSDSLCAADVHLVSLLPALEGLIVPSKLYGILAAGRPVLFIGDTNGEVAQVVRKGECGSVIAQGDGQALADQVLHYRSNPRVTAEQGSRARTVFERSYTLDAAAQKWHRVLQSVDAAISSAARD